ncbi:MAG: hypothetical protein HYZ28_10620 [Myxococcales bacterium]|nr:hypothetical protein [Myxococcales bacterium]
MSLRIARIAVVGVGLACIAARAAKPRKPPPLPKQCEAPELRDAHGLKQAAQEDSTLSMGLDSVATWCFDPRGEWNGGWTKKPKEEPSPDCARAIAACEKAAEVVKKTAALHELDALALADLDRPYLGARYQVKRGGVRDRPSGAASCRSRVRADLFSQAQQLMEKSRVHAQVLAEYGSYRSWLYAEGLKCQNAVSEALSRRSSKTELPRESVAAPRPAANVEAAGEAGAASRPAASAEEPSAAGTPGGGASAAEGSQRAQVTELVRAVRELEPMTKWKLLAGRASALEGDPEQKGAFRHSIEVKACRCARVSPAAILRALENREGGEAGVSLLMAEDAANTRCAVCWIDAYTSWKPKAERHCAAMASFTEAELTKLELSDDGPGIPRKCFDEVRSARASSATPPPALSQASADAGAPAASQATSGLLVNVGGYTYYRPPDAGHHRALSPEAHGSAASSGSTVSAHAPPGGLAPASSGGAVPQAGAPHSFNTAPAAPPEPLAGGAAAHAGAQYSVKSAPGAAPSGGGAAPLTQAGAPYPVKSAPSTTPPAAGTASGPSGGGAAAGAQFPVNAGRGSPPAPRDDRTAPAHDAFVPPQSYAPIPPREEGRLYVRISMSSACVAEILPGPIHARNGDLILVPLNARSLEVKSPCGGVAEIYYGKEPAPRSSEVFARNQPVAFVFRAQ